MRIPVDEKPDQVSVVIPCFNAAEFLPEAINSVLNQTYPIHEILVIDDGSTDDSVRIAESFGNRVRAIRQKNQGESIARNRGFELASGQWIAFLDADDVWLPEKLEKQLADCQPDTIATHSNVFLFGNVTGIVDSSIVPHETRYDLSNIVRNRPIHISSLIVRHSIRSRFPRWTRYNEDKIFYFDLVREGPIRLINELLTGYRHHHDSQSRHPDAALLKYESICRWADYATDVPSEQRATVKSIQAEMTTWNALRMLAELNFKGFRRYQRKISEDFSFLRFVRPAIRDFLRRRVRRIQRPQIHKGKPVPNQFQRRLINNESMNKAAGDIEAACVPSAQKERPDGLVPVNP